MGETRFQVELFGGWLRVLRDFAVGGLGITFRGWLGPLGGKVSTFKYFSDAEVAQWQLDPEVFAKLDQARDAAGIPFIITSGKRTPEQETALRGGVRDSSHIKGLGVDLSVTDDHSLCLMLAGLFSAGFRRIGIYVNAQWVPTHIHADIDPDLPQQVVWLKQEENS